jgi:hypothetical protein
MVKVATLKHSPLSRPQHTTNTSKRNDFTNWTLTEFIRLIYYRRRSYLYTITTSHFILRTHTTTTTAHITSDGKPKNSFTLNNVKHLTMLYFPFPLSYVP